MEMKKSKPGNTLLGQFKMRAVLEMLGSLLRRGTDPGMSGAKDRAVLEMLGSLLRRGTDPGKFVMHAPETMWTAATSSITSSRGGRQTQAGITHLHSAGS